jgi:hypothetical protein
MEYKEMGENVDWIKMAGVKYHWQILVNTKMNASFAETEGIF